MSATSPQQHDASTSPTPAPAITASLTKPPPSSSQPPRPNSSILHLYAELLLNIRTVSLAASLRSSHTAQTTATLAADGATVTLTHEGDSATIRLPTRVVANGGGSAGLTLPPVSRAGKEVCLRLRVEGEREGGGLGGEAGNVVPWGAAGMTGCEGVRCHECGACVVCVGRREGWKEKGGVKSWMDLPNENWAEMMDFWHCHKPHEHHMPGHKRGDEQPQKEYAAGNRIVARSGVGYVDLAYLLFREEDCCGVQPSPPKSDQPTNHQPLICSTCKTVVGVVDPRAEGWRIWKWSIAVTPKGSDKPQTHGVSKWIAAQLLYLIESQGVRKFTVTPDVDFTSSGESGNEEDRGPIMIWVFTPDIAFSSSVAAERRRDPTRAMKVLWKPAPAPTTPPAIEAGGASLSVEELRLPATAFNAFKAALEEGREWLPESARRFKEWDVGLVERFAEDEV
ncbi:ubiquitin-conjugating enzyme E2-binding protein [Macrophomina phaseolina]|uniref:Ubiquitin-conjugating enzyme E2-binding protein n=1 Tax=Macrophomina phaseolina TaxID=35725 RepID=A0ABQ8GMB9_9PEZI|nr:ubiquitin-conjugating enzyme E2-binding protein [Macrophomina phaseolina]